MPALRTFPRNDLPGLSFTNSATPWTFTAWQRLGRVPSLSINGLTYQFATPMGADIDVTFSMLFEVGTGDPGAETTIIQWNDNLRADTNVGYYLSSPGVLTLMEPRVVALNTPLSIRVACSGPSVSINAVRLITNVTETAQRLKAKALSDSIHRAANW